MLPELVARRLAEQTAKPGRKRVPGGGRRRNLFPYQDKKCGSCWSTCATIVSHAVVGQMFSVSADISENSSHYVVQLPQDLCPAPRFDAEKKWTKKEPAWYPETPDVVLGGSFETPVARPGLPDAQRKLYSRKKKRGKAGEKAKELILE